MIYVQELLMEEAGLDVAALRRLSKWVPVPLSTHNLGKIHHLICLNSLPSLGLTCDGWTYTAACVDGHPQVCPCHFD